MLDIKLSFTCGESNLYENIVKSPKILRPGLQTNSNIQNLMLIIVFSFFRPEIPSLGISRPNVQNFLFKMKFGN